MRHINYTYVVEYAAQRRGGAFDSLEKTFKQEEGPEEILQEIWWVNQSDASIEIQDLFWIIQWQTANQSHYVSYRMTPA
jgi:hypothetical protein